jgi:metal transporter CNNM
MGLDELHLRVLATSSEDLREKRNAQKGMELGFCKMFKMCLM